MVSGDRGSGNVYDGFFNGHRSKTIGEGSGFTGRVGEVFNRVNPF